MCQPLATVYRGVSNATVDLALGVETGWTIGEKGYFPSFGMTRLKLFCTYIINMTVSNAEGAEAPLQAPAPGTLAGNEGEDNSQIIRGASTNNLEPWKIALKRWVVRFNKTQEAQMRGMKTILDASKLKTTAKLFQNLYSSNKNSAAAFSTMNKVMTNFGFDPQNLDLKNFPEEFTDISVVRMATRLNIPLKYVTSSGKTRAKTDKMLKNDIAKHISNKKTTKAKPSNSHMRQKLQAQLAEAVKPRHENYHTNAVKRMRKNYENHKRTQPSTPAKKMSKMNMLQAELAEAVKPRHENYKRPVSSQINQANTIIKAINKNIKNNTMNTTQIVSAIKQAKRIVNNVNNEIIKNVNTSVLHMNNKGVAHRSVNSKKKKTRTIFGVY
jgi:hypothetical protein